MIFLNHLCVSLSVAAQFMSDGQERGQYQVLVIKLQSHLKLRQKRRDVLADILWLEAGTVEQEFQVADSHHTWKKRRTVTNNQQQKNDPGIRIFLYFTRNYQ